MSNIKDVWKVIVNYVVLSLVLIIYNIDKYVYCFNDVVLVGELMCFLRFNSCIIR